MKKLRLTSNEAKQVQIFKDLLVERFSGHEWEIRYFYYEINHCNAKRIIGLCKECKLHTNNYSINNTKIEFRLYLNYDNSLKPLPQTCSEYKMEEALK